MKNHTQQALEVILLEANEIMSRHDRVHAAHAARFNIACWVRNAKDFGIECVDWENVEEAITALRILNKTGKYPL